MEKTQRINNTQTMTEFPKMLTDILKEVRLLRKEVMMLFPQENLKNYAHADRIEDSYHKAMQEYPSLSIKI